MVEERKERSTGIFDGVSDVSCVCNAEFVDHSTANEVLGVGDEFVDEDVVVNCVAYDRNELGEGNGKWEMAN